MPTADPPRSVSPYLHLILTRWIDRRHARENEFEARREDLRSRGRALGEALAAGTQKRRGDRLELESVMDAAGNRWLERLRRLDEWIVALRPIRDGLDSVETSMRNARWFDRLEANSPRWIARLMGHADRWDERHAGLQTEIHAWAEAVERRLAELEKFAAAPEDAPELLVSRARRQPEIEFAEEQFKREGEIGDRLLALRHSVTLRLGRILRGLRAVEGTASRQPAFWEIHRRQLQELWHPAEERWRGLREDIMKEALVFEGGRQKLRRVQSTVRRIRCVEDVYRAPEPAWKKILGAISIK